MFHRRPATKAKIGRVALILGAGVSVVVATQGLAGCSSPQAPQSVVDIGSDYYQLTVNITNESTSQALTLQGVPRVDNNATLQAGYPTSVPAGGSATYQASNLHNGIQMWLTFTTSDGDMMTSDTDVHKTDGNNTKDGVNGNTLGFLQHTCVSSGQIATATIDIGDCGPYTCNPTYGWPQQKVSCDG